MAKRIIPIEVRDEYILGAGRVIGAKGSHDDVALRVEFNEMWHGKSITAVWLNAVGESPVVAPINFSNWEGSNPHICIIDIPAKAKSAVGDAMLTIRGFTSVDGETESTATLTATAYFKVLESDFDNEAEEEEEEDNLNLYQQLQNDIAALETTMSNAIVASKAAVDARDEAITLRNESKSNMEAAAISAGAAAGYKEDAARYASDASDFRDEAENYADDAKSWAVGGVYQGDDTNNAKYWSSKAEKAKAEAEAAQEAAETAKGEAQTAKGEAVAAKNEAQTAYTNANGEYKKAVEEAGKAAASATAAKSSADTAAEDAAAKAVGNVEGRLVGYVTQASGEVAKAEGEVVKAAASAQTASDKAVAAARSASSAESSAAAAAQSATQAANAVSGLKDTAAYLEDHLGEVADAEAAKLQRVADSVNEAVELAAVYKDDAWMAAERAEDAADRAEAAGGVSKGYVDEELEKKLDKTGGTITDGEYDTALEAGEIIVTNGFASAKVGCGGIDIALDSEGKDESVIIRKNKIEFSHTYEDDETGETVSKAKGIVRGLANATDDSDAVPYGQMVEYVAANGGGVSEEYVNEELAKKLDKTGGTMSDEEGISETTLSPYGVEIEDTDLRSQAKFDISGVHFTVSTDEGEVAGGGRISGLVDATLDHEAVPYGQMKAELDVVKTSVGEGKALIASAVTDKGVPTADDATFAQMAANIAAIESGGVELPELTNEGTSADLRKDKELINDEGEVVIGTMETFNGSYECSDDGTGGIKPIIDSLDITPTATDRTYDATEEGLDGYSPVVVRGDGNLAPENIVEGVSIFGVTGTAKTDVEPNLQDIDITPSHESRIYNASDGYDGFGEVYVNGEPNLVPENVVEGVKIFDVTGTAKTGGGGDDEYKETLIGVLDRTATNPVLPDGLTSIGTYAFYENRALVNPSLPNSVKSIGKYAFYNCRSLALTSLPSSVMNIYANAFQKCIGLALVSLPSNLFQINKYTFDGCTSLALTSLPYVSVIEDYAFRGCTNLRSITFIARPAILSSYAFSNCTNLTTINVPWAEGDFTNAPWGATKATINYNYTGG